LALPEHSSLTHQAAIYSAGKELIESQSGFGAFGGGFCTAKNKRSCCQETRLVQKAPSIHGAIHQRMV
jgi:hypothetical protein